MSDLDPNTGAFIADYQIHHDGKCSTWDTDDRNLISALCQKQTKSSLRCDVLTIIVTAVALVSTHKPERLREYVCC